MTGLCRVVDHVSHTLIDPRLVPMEAAEEWAYTQNKRHTRHKFMALDVWQLALMLRNWGVDNDEANDLANDVFLGKIADRFVVIHGSGCITDWYEKS